MSWDWSGFGGGLGEGMARFGELGVRHALDSQLLQEKAALEKQSDEFKLRLKSQIEGEERSKMVADVDRESQGILGRHTLDNAKKAGWEFSDENDQPVQVNSWDEVEDDAKKEVMADPEVQATKSQEVDAKVMGAFRAGYLSAKDLAEYVRKDEREQLEWLYKMNLLQDKDLDRKQREELKIMEIKSRESLHKAVGGIGKAADRADARAELRSAEQRATKLYDDIVDLDKKPVVGTANKQAAAERRGKLLKELQNQEAYIKDLSPRTKSRPRLSDSLVTGTPAGLPAGAVVRGTLGPDGKLVK